MAYQKPNVSRLTRAAHIAAVQKRGLSGAARSGVRARVMRGGLGDWFDDMTAGQDVKPIDIPQGGGFTPVQSYSGGEFTPYNPGGIQTSSGGSGIGTGVTSFFGKLFGSAGTTTPGYVPTTSNTSTYLLIGAVVVGGIVLVTLLK